MADKYQHEIKRSLREIGFSVRFDPTSRFSTREEIGRADGIVSHGSHAAYIECKTAHTAWNTQKWTKQQREFAAKSELPYFIALTIGTGKPNLIKEGMLPRKSYIIPYSVVIPVVEWVEAHGFNSIPYQHYRNTHSLIKHFNISIEKQFAPYGLMWAGKGVWVIPPKNPLITHLRREGV